MFLICLVLMSFSQKWQYWLNLSIYEGFVTVRNSFNCDIIRFKLILKPIGIQLWSQVKKNRFISMWPFADAALQDLEIFFLVKSG